MVVILVSFRLAWRRCDRSPVAPAEWDTYRTGHDSVGVGPRVRARTVRTVTPPRNTPRRGPRMRDLGAPSCSGGRAAFRQHRRRRLRGARRRHARRAGYVARGRPVARRRTAAHRIAATW